jgi:hypothetical protein
MLIALDFKEYTTRHEETSKWQTNKILVELLQKAVWSFF